MSTTPTPTLYGRFAPPLSAMPLIVFLLVYVTMPIWYSWPGFAFATGTIMFTVGIYPHVHKLSAGGHKLDFAFNWRGRRIEWQLGIRIPSRKWANRIVGIGLLILIILMLPAIGFVLQHQGVVFGERIQAQQDTVNRGLEGILGWAREKAPGYVPQGDVAGVLGGMLGQVFGDIKKAVLAVSGLLFKLTKVAVKDWFELIVATIVVGVLIQEWKKEVKMFRWRIEVAFDGSEEMTTLRRRILRLLELYQDGLSILMIGFLEVGMTLSIYYFLAMLVLPVNLGFGAMLLFALIFGFITAIWKVGGIVTKVLAPVFMVLNFQPGLGWFGFEVVTFGLWVDIAIKAGLMFAMAFVGGALEAYNFTPEKVGKRLGLTKLEMVMTILIWAIGTGFFGMIWGVLLMLSYQAITALYKEESCNDPFKEVTG